MILFYLLITVLPFVRHPLWNRLAGEFTLIKYLGAACLVYALLYSLQRKTVPHFLESRHARWFLVFILIACTSYFVAGPPFTWEDNKFISYVSFLGLFVVTLSLVDSLPRLRWTLLTAVGSVAWASLYVLREWYQLGGVARAGWLFGDANYFTVSATLTLPVAYALMIGPRPRWERLFCLGASLITLAAVTVGASRGGILGLGAAFLFLTMRSRKRAREFLIAGVLLVPLVVISPVSPLSRLLNPTDTDSRSAESRLVVWTAGLRMLTEEPVFGIGLSNFKAHVPEYVQEGLPDYTRAHIAHNTYLEIAVELGLPALGVFITMFVHALSLLRALHQSTGQTATSLVRQAALGMHGGLLGFAVSAFFISAQYQKLLWLTLFVAACMPGVAASARTRPSVGRHWVMGQSA